MMTSLRARKLAVEALVACFNAAQADGFQQHETEEWADAGAVPVLLYATETRFDVDVGGHRIRFRAAIVNGGGP